MIWTPLDTWIVAAAAVAGAACALSGSFLVLRKMSMMGDAISHAVLPGIAVAFILTASRASGALFIGAALVGILTAVLVQIIRQYGRVDHGASMGVVFTVLFAIGLLLIERAAGQVDIHPEHVLFGSVELVPLYTIRVLGADLPRGVVVVTIALVANLVVFAALFKEFRLATFDPELATTLGVNAKFMHYLLMTLVAITTVASFEVVGSILVVAMLVVPGATAHLLTRRLLPFLTVAVVVAISAAVLGHLAAIGVPPLFGFEDTSTAGSMAVVLGGLFFVAFLFAPEHGVVAKASARIGLRVSILTQDVLGLLARVTEGAAPTSTPRTTTDTLREYRRSPFRRHRSGLRLGLTLLRLRGLVRQRDGRYALTGAGRDAASRILRTHRLWERFFFDEAGVDLSELHHAADYLEHYTDADLQGALSEELSRPVTDPRGRRIPE
ncbi:MAG: iron ABC transporter [Spirochaetaceae bacterium]|nr:MAG: iron ABC transporter [Spirochaetaceae bacterium]